ncbi:MAG: putative DNA modification/repair radical SAM protein [Niameybacter sp.]|uniref:putative DNA modification/repair radical SAM protein n=1 Tax=Niameybacter sp. TaxID=2033640 RepID=UPI002FC9CC4B
MDLKTKLEILSDAAKYDVSCSSSGSNRKPEKGKLGSTNTSGICHSFTPDGRCISLLKILLTNYCVYDCAYCINRHSNDIPRATFTVDEVVNLTINFYRRNYIEGLFLSSAIIQNPNHTMELLTAILRKLRNEYNFRGYIHVKAIPGASDDLIKECGLYADRMSVNIELPSSQSLKLLAPNKAAHDILKPMNLIRTNIIEHQDNLKAFRHAPLFVPGGQSTQLIVGATPESDLKIMQLSEGLYNKYDLKRVYYSAYIPINQGSHLPIIKSPPVMREHRLYQGDWLLRYYGFKVHELLDTIHPNFDINFDPKTSWALRHMDQFPLEVNTAPFELLIRVPGIGIRGAKKIISSRRLAPLSFDDLKKLRIILKRAQYFILCQGKYNGNISYDEEKIRLAIKPELDLNLIEQSSQQLSLFDTTPIPFLLLNDLPTALTGEL